MTFATSSIVNWNVAYNNNTWGMRALTYPQAYVPRNYNFDLVIDPPRETARELGERLRRHLNERIPLFFGLRVDEFRPNIEHLIRDWLVYNATAFRQWTINLTETYNEYGTSVWTLNLILDNETIEIQFTVNT